MPTGLQRYQSDGDDHFITFSCHDRRPYLNTATARDLFLTALESTRKGYGFQVFGYVVMPEHVHLLLSEPPTEHLSKALGALKLSVSKQSKERPFWLTRYYDRNVLSYEKHTEKLRYMHRNPVTRGLVEKKEDWAWSTYHHYLLGESCPVEISKPEWKDGGRVRPNRQDAGAPSSSRLHRD